jgi:hypothetical protein
MIADDDQVAGGEPVHAVLAGMARRLIDVSMPVDNEMVTFPRVVPPSMVMYQNWRTFAPTSALRESATSAARFSISERIFEIWRYKEDAAET